MKNLSYTQEYYLLALNENGKMPALKSIDISACLLVSAIMELKENGYIEADEKGKYTAAKLWDNTLPYLKPVYDTLLNAKKPQSAKSLAEKYVFSEKNMNELLQAIGSSLVVLDCATEMPEKGLIKRRTLYAPNSKDSKRVIEKIRAEFLESGSVSDEAVCLGALLDKSGLVRNYFSKAESGELKSRLKQIRESEAYATVKELVEFIDTLIAIIASSGASV